MSFSDKEWLRSLLVTGAGILGILGLLAGCGGGGGGSDSGGNNGSTSRATVQGSATKGIVVKGNVVASELDSSGAAIREVGSAITGPDGSYSLVLDDSYEGGPIQVKVIKGMDTTMVCDASSGCGPRTDGLADGNGSIDFGEVYVPGILTMTAVIPSAGDGETIGVQITPFTHMAAEKVLTDGTFNTTTITAANSEVSNLLGGIDILRTEPVDITSLAGGEDSVEVAYAALLAAVVETADVDGDGQPDINKSLSELADQFSGGTFMAADMQQLLNGVSDVLALVGATDTSGLIMDIQTGVNDAIANNGGVIDPEPGPNPGVSNVALAKAFISDLRTWGSVIGGELDSPGEAFANQIDLTGEAMDLLDDFRADGAAEAFLVTSDLIANVIRGNDLEVGIDPGPRQCARGNSIAFDDVGVNNNLGTLFWANEMEISELDPITGGIIGMPVLLDFSAIGRASFSVVAMDFHPVTGDLYAAVQQGQAQSQPKSTLAILDPLAGTFTLIGAAGNTGVKLDGIAFTSDGTLYGTSTGAGTGEHGSGGGSGNGPGNFTQFHQINLNTGVASEISADIGFGGDVGGLAANSSDLLFAGTGGRGPNDTGRTETPSLLFTIDPATGLGNPEIGPLGIEFGPPLSTELGEFDQFTSMRQNISGWSFDPDGTLYGMTGRGSQLFSANTTTGLATRIGTPCDSVEFIRYPADPELLLAGMVTVSSNNGQSTYTISNANVIGSVGSDFVDARLHMVVTAPDNETSVNPITLEIQSAVAEDDDSRWVVKGGTIDVTLPGEHIVDYGDDFATDVPSPVSAVVNLEVAVTKRTELVYENGFPTQIINAKDPITFAGNFSATVYSYIHPNTGEIEDFLPGSFTLGGNVSNTTGDSLDVTASVSIPTAAADVQNPAVEIISLNDEIIELEFYDAGKPLIASTGLQFDVQFDGLPEARISITGNTTAFEEGNADVTISYGNRNLRFDVSNDTAGDEVGLVTITNLDGVELILRDDDPINGVREVTINGAKVADIQEFDDGLIKTSYIDGTFEIF